MSADLATARRRPAPGEFDAFYAGYLASVDDAPILDRLGAQTQSLAKLLGRLREGAGNWRYADGKWSVAEVLGHLADSERVFGMRATCIARGETADLPGFEQDDYVVEGNFGDRTIDSLLRELTHLRGANVEMFDALPAAAWDRSGSANGARITVRALAWILAGHYQHHLSVLQDRYAPAFGD